VWYRTSALNSTLFAVDADGAVVAHMIYDPFGKALCETYTDANLSGLDNLNNYTGYTWDETLELYFAQNRFYDAVLHRFTQEDAVKDGRNWYAYCGNSPLVYVDADGKYKELSNMKKVGKTDSEIEKKTSSYFALFCCAGFHNEVLNQFVITQRGYWKVVTSTPLADPPMIYIQPKKEQLFLHLMKHYEETYQSINVHFRRYMEEVGAL